jgi:hypothetical protein
MNAAERVMPVIDVIGPRADGSFVVHLPGQVYRVAPDEAAARRLVTREASGSAVRLLTAGDLSRSRAG